MILVHLKNHIMICLCRSIQLQNLQKKEENHHLKLKRNYISKKMKALIILNKELKKNLVIIKFLVLLNLLIIVLLIVIIQLNIKLN